MTRRQQTLHRSSQPFRLLTYLVIRHRATEIAREIADDAGLVLAYQLDRRYRAVVTTATA